MLMYSFHTTAQMNVKLHNPDIQEERFFVLGKWFFFSQMFNIFSFCFRMHIYTIYFISKLV